MRVQGFRRSRLRVPCSLKCWAELASSQTMCFGVLVAGAGTRNETPQP